ncbi:unnamed protein product [Ambrosiozyma monospora]|uniref:Unnamed protein product n=1 Tax=Ambrosiozyma monospora TaxID=43982 RepID=A0ACB5SWP2_AMBMO|nr:unnamed protein product [Ambrosiozyma monospora]
MFRTLSRLSKSKTSLKSTFKSIRQHEDQPCTPEQPHNLLSILTKPESNNESEVFKDAQLKAHEVGKFTRIENSHFFKVSSNLNYILNTFGTRETSLTNRQQLLLDKLIHETNGKGRYLQISEHLVKSEEDAMLVFSYLLLQNQMSISLFARLVMKLHLQKLLLVERRLANDHFLLGYDTDPEIAIKAHVLIAFRLKMTGALVMAQFYVEKYLKSVWLPAVKCGVFVSPAYQYNMLQLCSNFFNNSILSDLVIQTGSPLFAYRFWEISPSSHKIREFLQEFLESHSLVSESSKVKEILSRDTLSRSQILFVNLLSNPLISSSQEFSTRLGQLSKKFQLGMSSSSHQNNTLDEKMLAFLDLLLKDLADDVHEGDRFTLDEIKYFSKKARLQLCQFKRSNKINEDELISQLDVKMVH